MAGNVSIFKFKYHLITQCRSLMTSPYRAVKIEDVDKEITKIRPFNEIPKLKQSPKTDLLKTMLNVFGKHQQDFRRDKYFEKVYEKFGPIVSRGEVFGPATVHLFDPKDVGTVYRNEDSSPIRIAFDTVRLAREHIRDVLRKRGTVEGNGNEWYVLRKKFQGPMLRVKNIENLCTHMDGVAVEFVNNVSSSINENGEIEHLIDELYKWALESVGLVVFDCHLGAMNRSLSSTSDTFKLLEAINETFSITYKYELGIPWHKWFKTPAFKKLINAQKYMAEMAINYTTATLERMKHLPAEDIEKSSFLIQMLFRQDVDLDDVVIMITDILFGGIDTTSHSSAMLMYHLAKNQSVQDKLFSEITRVLPDLNTVITADHLNKLSYLKACVKETHRLTPVVDAMSRVLKKDVVLAGYNVPAGTNVIIHHRTMGRIRFEEPTKFKPERWLADDDGRRRKYQFAWLPFGHGVRSCLGKRIAEQETHLIIARMLQKYHLTSNSDEEVGMISRFVNIPDRPIRVKFNQRN